MKFLNEGDSIEIKGSAKLPYILKKVGGIVSCSCPAWRNFGGSLDVRTCKHIKANIDVACLLPQTVNAAKSTEEKQPKLTKTGKVSTAVGGAVVKETAPPCLLAHKWTDEDPTGMMMSEKLDGVRAWWDGTDFISRLGNTYHAPQWFKDRMPKYVLDGELWAGRTLFQKTISIVKKLIPDDKEWEQVQFVVFDMPKLDLQFEERIAQAKRMIPQNKSIFVLEQVRCLNANHLKQILNEFKALGGEGVMLREAASLYEEGRSKTCLKVKTFIDDEATVVGHTSGKGKHKGRTGALAVVWNDIPFEIGTGLSDKEREKPPEIGQKITFRYTELTNKGVPKCASFVCVRNYE